MPVTRKLGKPLLPPSTSHPYLIHISLQMRYHRICAVHYRHTDVLVAFFQHHAAPSSVGPTPCTLTCLLPTSCTKQHGAFRSSKSPPRLPNNHSHTVNSDNCEGFIIASSISTGVSESLCPSSSSSEAQLMSNTTPSNAKYPSSHGCTLCTWFQQGL